MIDILRIIGVTWIVVMSVSAWALMVCGVARFISWVRPR